MPFAAQAADVHLRRSHSLDGVDDLRLTEVLDQGDRTIEARFEARDGGALAAMVRVVDALPERPFTCRSVEASVPPAYEVREIDTSSG